MPKKSIEERIRILEEENAAMKQQIVKVRDVTEIQNLLGRYEAIHNPTDIHRSWELFATHTPDTWMEISDWGHFDGYDMIKKLWTGMDNPDMKVGTIFEHDLATPIIEVAEDGKTAKGTWCSPGFETHIKPNGKREPVWCWGKYAIDFVKEDGEWKFWHFKWFRTFMIPFDTSWVDAPLRPSMRHKLGKPSRYHKPYQPTEVAVSIPPAPKPYKTWTAKENDWQFRTAKKP